MADISLLPEGLRGKEQAAQHQKTPPSAAANGAGLKMHVPESTAEEDIEIIEVDESDLGTILADEPLFTRLSYQLSAALDDLKEKLFAKSELAPPKLPPQFFTPPRQGLVSKPGMPGATAPLGARPAAGGAPGAAGTSFPRARITPQAEAPRRVRVIRRVRKPVRISLLSAEEMALVHIDVPRRKWTLVVCSVLFAAVIAGGYALLSTRVAEAQAALNVLSADLDTTRTSIRGREMQWSAYRDLQYRLTLLDDLLNRHVLVSRVLDFLERQTLPQVSYNSADISADGSIALDVMADNYEFAAQQIVAYHQSPIVERADSLSFAGSIDAEGGKSTVSFSVSLKLEPEALRGPLLDAAASSTPLTTSTSAL